MRAPRPPARARLRPCRLARSSPWHTPAAGAQPRARVHERPRPGQAQAQPQPWPAPQALACDARDAPGDSAAQRSAFHGLLGGYQCYEHVVCTRLAPHGRVQRLRLHRPPRSVAAALFATSMLDPKLLLVDVDTADVMARPAGLGLGPPRWSRRPCWTPSCCWSTRTRRTP